MPVEAKPIFHPDVIRLPILGFTLPEHVAQRRQNLRRWSDIISSGSIDEHKEQEILGDFLNDVFCESHKQLRKFVFLLHASRMVPLHGPSHLG